MNTQPQHESESTLKLGLTGGIGSGKTKVADLLQDLGASIIDTDAIAHSLTAPGGLAIEPIREAFGDQVIDAQGALDRAQMRQKVFKDANARIRLEGILHPLIRQEVAREAQKATGLYRVFVVPLLVESGRWLEQVDRVCVVDCDEATQIARVMARSQLSAEQVEEIMMVQATRDERLAVAHDVIDNGANTDFENLRQQVLVLHRLWCNLTE
ncbi:dephospho-CoA kinase [Orrella sp. 11846]|uniref:dephospho-CoA kinase n=1 Tax=Orrella sp. 11846 TaxID=3409913 RepID=UPI003B5C0303